MAANTIALYAVTEGNTAIITSAGLYGNGLSSSNGVISSRSTSVGLYGTLQTQFPTNAQQLIELLSNQDNVKFYLTDDNRFVYAHTDLNPPLYGTTPPAADLGVGDQFYINTAALDLWWKHPDTLVWLLVSSGQGDTIPLIHFPVVANGNNQSFINEFIADYPNVESLSAMRNGVLVPAVDYVLTGNTITFNIQLFENDNIDILPTGVGAGGGSEYSNANVMAYLPTYTGNIGNITTNNASISNVLTDNLLYANGVAWNFFNANTLANYLPNYTGNIRANNFLGGNFNGNVGVFNTVIAGNLTFSNVSTLDIANKVITLAVGSPNAIVSDGGGVILTNAAQLLYNFSTNEWQSNVAIRATGNIVGDNVVTDNLLRRDGSPWVFSSYSNANVENYLPVYDGNVGNGGGTANFANVIVGNLRYPNGSSYVFSDYSNANVIALLAGGTVGNIVVQAGGNLVSDTLKFSNGANALYSNLNAANLLANFAGNVSFTGENVSLGTSANLHIFGGSGGQVLSTDGMGGLSWVNQSGGGNANGIVNATGTLVFSVTANGNNQVFTNDIIANFTNAYNLNVVKDGVVLEPIIDFDKSGNSIIINRDLTIGSTIDVLSTIQGGGSVGADWDAPANIAVGDIFTGFVANYVNPGSIYTANTDINTNLRFWQALQAPVYADWGSVTYGNGTFVAISGLYDNSNIAATSSDGVTWTQRSLPVNSQWSSVTYGANTFVALSFVSTIAATSPDGITWTQQTLPVSAYWSSVAYGANTFVAVAGGTAAATSPDGITWTQQTLPVSAEWVSVAYGANTFVAVAGSFSADTNIAATSSDGGVTWTQQTLPATTRWSSVAYGANTFVAMSYSTITATSPDGVDWTQHTIYPEILWRSVTYGANTFVAVASDGGGIAATSPDGVTWTQRSLPVSTLWQSVAYGGNHWVAVAPGLTFASPAETNLIYVEHTEQTAPAGTYRCLGGVDPIYPIYLWTRVT